MQDAGCGFAERVEEVEAMAGGTLTYSFIPNDIENLTLARLGVLYNMAHLVWKGSWTVTVSRR